jgi:hexosaminidase
VLSSAMSASATLDKVKNVPQKENILGIEGALWSETLASYEHLTYMALPKMAGLAEASWSPANSTDWKNLSNRLGCGSTGFLHYLYKLYNVHYRGYPYGISLEIPADQCRSDSNSDFGVRPDNLIYFK